MRGQERGAERERREEPQRIADVVAHLMARRGYGRIQSARELDEAWRTVCGSLASQTRPGNVNRGVLDVYVANSVVLQELNFQKATLLKQLRELAPQLNFADLRFRLGQIH